MMDLNGHILESVEGSTIGMVGPEDTLKEIYPHIDAMVGKADKYKILGIGAAVPGPMNVERGVLLNPPNFAGWEGFALRRQLEDRYAFPVFIEDDARTSAIAERWFSKGKDGSSLVFISMGMGIGSGLISGGDMVRGSKGIYGQIGHVTIEPHGDLCACGNYGCWETVGSIPGILKRWSGGITMEELLMAAERGETEAVQCIEDTLHYLEISMTNVFNMYGPDVIVLGGKLYPYLEPLLEDVIKRVKARTFTFAHNEIVVRSSSFGSSQSAIGAAAMVFRELLLRPISLLNRTTASEGQSDNME